MRVSEPYTIFPRKFPSGKIVYYYQYRMDNGQRSTPKSTGCSTEASAKRFCNKLYNQGEFEKTSLVRFDNYTNGFFNTDSRYYKWKIANKEHLSLETLLAYDKFLRNQLLPFFADYKLCAIKRANVKDWVIWANDRWSPKTVNSAQTVLNLIFKQAIDEEVIENNPCYNLSFRDIQKKPRELLSLEEVQKIYHSEKWWYDNQKLFLLDIITGMRISEVVALRNEDVKENYIQVGKTYSRTFGMEEHTKTYISRYVPIPSELAQELHVDREFLFVNHKGKKKGQPMDINSFYTNLLMIYESLGIDYKKRNLAVHTNRDFYNTYLRSENITDAKIRAVIGHKDKDMTDLYTYWKPEMFKEVYEAQDKLYHLIKG